ncbi:hypothetical protein GGI42DRAFT_338560 [Trichoderma sp. SZMC 28013]
MSKLVHVAIITITGAQACQGGWKIQGVTRAFFKPGSQILAAKGIDVVNGYANYIAFITATVQGSSILFRNTAFSSAFAMLTAEDLAKLELSQTLRGWCYETELQEGKPIPMLGGKYAGAYHFDPMAHVMHYIKNKHPKLAQKMSIFQMDLFITGPGCSAMGKGTQHLDSRWFFAYLGRDDVPIAFVVPSDTGYPGYVQLWSKVTGIPATFKKITVAEHDNFAPGGYSEEIAEMYAYVQDFDYDGGAASINYAQDLSVEVPVTRIDQYIESKHWSLLLQ